MNHERKCVSAQQLEGSQRCLKGAEAISGGGASLPGAASRSEDNWGLTPGTVGDTSPETLDTTSGSS